KIPSLKPVFDKNGTVTAADSVVNEIDFDIPKNALGKNETAILNIMAANKWKRPIYFTMAYDDLGFQNYLRKDGMSYRLVPVAGSPVNTDWVYKLVMDPKKWGYGNANLPGVYFDEENRRHLNDIRKADLELAYDLIFKDRKEDARKVLEKSDKMILEQNFAYGEASRNNDHNRLSLAFLDACYRADDQKLAAKVLASLKKDLQQQMRYYDALTDLKADNMDYEKRNTANILQQLEQLEKSEGPQKTLSPETGIIGGDSNALPNDSLKK
ncbi:MAG: hypothetical protein ABI861_10045, partial [Panacibacter sp.]